MRGGELTVYGHEAAGFVEKAGAGAADFSPGDSVVLSYPHCGVCPACRDGRPYNCVHFSALFMGERLSGLPTLRYKGRSVTAFFGQGGFATHTVVHKSSAVRVPPDMDLKKLAPLGCGIQTGAGAVMNVLRPEPNGFVAVFGTGSVGLSSVLAARVLGCSVIIAADKVGARLELARRFGRDAHGRRLGLVRRRAGNFIVVRRTRQRR